MPRLELCERELCEWLCVSKLCVGVCVCGQPLFPRDLRFFSFSVFQFFSFKAGGASSPFSLTPTKTLDECWWYLTWSVRRTCHETISISEFCDSFTAATLLNWSLFKTCLSTTAFSRAKNHKSIWASWTDILSYKCVWVCVCVRVCVRVCVCVGLCVCQLCVWERVVCERVVCE